MGVRKDFGKSAKSTPKTEEENTKHEETIDEFLYPRKCDETGRLPCPHCGGTHVVKYGFAYGRQRNKCMDCNRTFSLTTNTVLEQTRKDLKTWKKYIACMGEKYSLRRCAAECNICLRTAFFWRHKLLDTLSHSSALNL